MESIRIAILGCGTVGGGVAKIINELSADLNERAACKVELSKIVELSPVAAAERFNLPLDVFCGGGKELTKEEAGNYINEIITGTDIDLVVETIGGTSDFVKNICEQTLKNKKHLVTANKALLAERGADIFKASLENNVQIGYEAAVCGAIPIIKTIRESFTGDSIISVSGIMNGTSNYILTMMQNEGLEFDAALKLAQENGYAEADPTLDINGGDAAHKIILLIKLAYGMDVTMEQLKFKGIQAIGKDDIEFADEIGCNIKLICYAKQSDNKLYATVQPMMVKRSNILSGVNDAINAVRVNNKYSGKHILVGAGAGSSETASSIVADIVFIAKYAQTGITKAKSKSYEFLDAEHFVFPYIITFDTTDKPGITGFVTTAIGKQDINIDTVSHNKRDVDHARFSVLTQPCTLQQVNDAINEIKQQRPDSLIAEPKIIPVLY